MTTATLTVNNVWTQVTTPDDRLIALLDKRLATWVKGAERRWEYKSRQWDGYEHHLTQNHKFRTGLLETVSGMLKEAGCSFNVVDERERPDFTPQDINLKGKTPRDYQLDAVDAAIAAGRGTIQHGTSGGKTVTMAALSQRVGLPTLMVVDQAWLMKQTADEWAIWLDEPIGILGGSMRKKLNARVVCATFQSVNAWLKKDKAACMEWLARFDILFVDEAHHLVADTYQAAADKCPAYFRWNFSATAFKSSGKKTGPNEDPRTKMHVVGTAGPILHQFDAGDLADDGWVVPAHIVMWNWRKPTWWPRYRDDETEFDINDAHHEWSGRKATKKHAAQPGLYRTAIIKNDDRNAAVVRAVVECVSDNLPTLVLTDKKEHAIELQRLIRQHYDQSDITRYVSGKDSLAQREKMKVELETGALKVLIATTVFDEGVNAPGIGALVMAGGGKAQHRLKQRLGRGMRLSEGKTELAVIDFYDTHSKLMWIHSEQRKAAYKSDPAGYTVEVIS